MRVGPRLAIHLPLPALPQDYLSWRLAVVQRHRGPSLWKARLALEVVVVVVVVLNIEMN